MPPTYNSAFVEHPAKRPRLSGPPTLPVADGFSKPKDITPRKQKIPVFESHFGDSNLTSDVHSVAGRSDRISHRKADASKVQCDSLRPSAGTTPTVDSSPPSTDVSLKRRIPLNPFDAFPVHESPSTAAGQTSTASLVKPAVGLAINKQPSQSQLQSISKLPSRIHPIRHKQHPRPNSRGKPISTIKISNSSPGVSPTTKPLRKPDPFLFSLPELEKSKQLTRLAHSLTSQSVQVKPETPPLKHLRPPEFPIPVPKETPLLRSLPPPPLIAEPPSAEPSRMKTITTTGIAKATDPSTVIGNAKLLSLFTKDENAPDENEPGSHPLYRGLFVSPNKDRTSLRKGPKYVRGGLAAQAAMFLSQSQTSLSLWQKEINSRIASSHIPPPDTKLHVLKIVHMPRLRERHPTSRPGVLICKDSKDIPHAVVLSFSNHDGMARGTNSLKLGSEVWCWKPWTVKELTADPVLAGIHGDEKLGWAVVDESPVDDLIGGMRTARRRCADIWICSHFYVRAVKG